MPLTINMPALETPCIRRLMRANLSDAKLIAQDATKTGALIIYGIDEPN